MREVITEICAGVRDAGTKALVIERKKGVEVGTLDAPEIYHWRLALRLSQPRRFRIFRFDHHAVVERGADQAALHGMHHANIPASVPPLPVLLLGIHCEDQ